MSRRIDARFAQLKASNVAGFIPFVTAGDPDFETSRLILRGLPGAGADLIEIGMPFSDPMAEGKPIQASSLRALQGGQTMARTLSLVRDFRETDAATPVVLMGYANPIVAYGVERFCADAGQAGADGLIVVDMPPEEDSALRRAADAHDLDVIRLATPTTDAHRLAAVLDGASGFVYYVSVTGVTGAQSVQADRALANVAAIRARTALPIAVGFGIKTPHDARAIARSADAAVVGSAIVQRVADFIKDNPRGGTGCVQSVLSFCRELSAAVRAARE
jgi:tryptophan synthase alpha chain